METQFDHWIVLYGLDDMVGELCKIAEVAATDPQIARELQSLKEDVATVFSSALWAEAVQEVEA